MKNIKKTYIGALLAASIITTSTLPCIAAENTTDYYSNSEWHSDTPFDELEYVHPDSQTIYDLVDELETLISSEGNDDKVISVYYELAAAFKEYYTMDTLAYIKYSLNAEDTYYQDEYTSCDSELTRIADSVSKVLSNILESSYEQLYIDEVGSEYAETYRNYEATSEEELELIDKITELENDYYDLQFKDYTVTFDGEEWDYERLDEEYSNMTYSDYVDIYTDIYKEMNSDMGEVYLELVEARTELADLYGYDNYAEYSYESEYSRDYSIEDSREFHKVVKKYIVPIANALERNWTSDYYSDYSSVTVLEGDEILDFIEPYMGEISSELAETFSYMREYGYYDNSPSDSKLDMGYTIGLDSLASAFFFDSPYGSSSDISTAIHEFGHYNTTFHDPDMQDEDALLYSISSIDIAEVHSQGLELLFTQFYDDMYGDNAEALNYYNIYSLIVSSIIYGCIYDEFQIEVYENPDMTLEEINVLFKEISDSYNVDTYTNDNQNYDWVNVSHTFDSPMYYISYATSAMASLNIWMDSLDDMDKAIDEYLTLTSYGTNVYFCDTLDSSGFDDIFSEEYAMKLASCINQELSLGLSLDYDKDNEDNDVSSPQSSITGAYSNEEIPDSAGIVSLGVLASLLILFFIFAVVIIIQFIKNHPRR